MFIKYVQKCVLKLILLPNICGILNKTCTLDWLSVSTTLQISVSDNWQNLLSAVRHYKLPQSYSLAFLKICVCTSDLLNSNNGCTDSHLHWHHNQCTLSMWPGLTKLVLSPITESLIFHTIKKAYSGVISLLATQKAKSKKHKTLDGFFNWPKNFVLQSILVMVTVNNYHNGNEPCMFMPS